MYAIFMSAVLIVIISASNKKHKQIDKHVPKTYASTMYYNTVNDSSPSEKNGIVVINKTPDLRTENTNVSPDSLNLIVQYDSSAFTKKTIQTDTSKNQETTFDLKNPECLKSFGIGRIFETDNTSIKNIKLTEVGENHIVYEKNGSLHDFPIEKIQRIEFPQAKWGPLIIKFVNNVAEFHAMY